MSAADIRVAAADYAADYDAIRFVRFTVFVNEQAVPAELEMDERDPHCFHVIAYDGDAPVGTGRIDLDDGGRVGRMAVLASHRDCGVGRAMLEALHAYAGASDCREVWCHAQVAAPLIA